MTALYPEKLFTQAEVDASYLKGQASRTVEATPTQEAVQDLEKQKKLDSNTVAGLVKQSNRILVSISTHMLPFDFFPDIINIEESRITIITRHMFSSQVHSVDIKDISNVFINSAFLYSQLVIISRTFEDNEIALDYLHKKDAVFARRIIEGLRVFNTKQIDTSTYTQDELIAKLEELSTTEIVT